MSKIPFRNPGWAGNVGEYKLTEEQVRGIDFVGVRPLEGGHAAAASRDAVALAASAACGHGAAPALAAATPARVASREDWEVAD